MATPTAIVAYLALFAGVAGLFLFANLLIGRLTRPNLPNEEKLEVYECGEPVIGSSFVQFDLRFYVVALLFIIFDVEVAFFFPWATVFGKSVQLTSPNMQLVASELDESSGQVVLSAAASRRLQELGVANPILPEESAEGLAAGEQVQQTAQRIALTSFADIAVFFAVLLVGFAYVWRRGDLDWVRAVSSQRGEVVERAPPHSPDRLPRSSVSVLSA
ncbi:MAG: NADH-quinone oxidoreductase subunit A [Planctomycetales bacterium]|nr:NADH-quinone oxidoreductase subunit A [Planctomycetales bacterium]